MTEADFYNDEKTQLAVLYQIIIIGEVVKKLYLNLALKIDEMVKTVRADDWRGNTAKENTIKGALFALLNQDIAEVERIFLIIQEQPEY